MNKVKTILTLILLLFALIVCVNIKNTSAVSPSTYEYYHFATGYKATEKLNELLLKHEIVSYDYSVVSFGRVERHYLIVEYR